MIPSERDILLFMAARQEVLSTNKSTHVSLLKSVHTFEMLISPLVFPLDLPRNQIQQAMKLPCNTLARSPNIELPPACRRRIGAQDMAMRDGIWMPHGFNGGTVDQSIPPLTKGSSDPKRKWNEFVPYVGSRFKLFIRRRTIFNCMWYCGIPIPITAEPK